MRASEFWFFRINYLCTIQIQDGNGIKTGYGSISKVVCKLK